MKFSLKIRLTQLVLLVFFGHLSLAGQTRPNIIVILTDDMGYADVGFNNGAADIVTPNLDQLAAAGTIFSSAYVAHPFCGPSRTALLTGRYPHKLGAQYNLEETDLTNGIDLNEVFISKLLQTGGYKTGAFGKWHLGQDTAYQPNSRGFDYFYGFLPGGHNFFTAAGGTNPYTWPLRKNFNAANEGYGLYLTDLFSDESVNFINGTETNDAQPFFMYVAYNAPHYPIQPKPADVTAITSAPYNKVFPNTAEGNKRRDYVAMVYAVDRGVKQIVDALKANGEFDNTLIVFLSDNGGKIDPLVDAANNAPLKGFKGETTEGGYRVPMFMHYPNHIPAGVKYDHPVTSLDFYPTFAALAQTAIPSGKLLDGKDIYNNIVAKTPARAGESIYALRHKTINNVGIRRDQWKAYSTGNGTWQLYNIVNDIGETTNVASSNQAILTAMVSDAYQWSKTNIDAKFFDSPSAQTTWTSNNLPDYPKTFAGYTTSLSTPEFLSNTFSFLNIYPNPLRESEFTIGLNFQPSNQVDVIVYDLLGHVVQIQKNAIVEPSNEIKVKMAESLINGTYYVRVVSGEKSFSKALIINR